MVRRYAFYTDAMMQTAILLSIGDELALGQTVDTNAAWLAARLSGLGIATRLHETVADDRALIAASIRWAAGRADLLIITGGLGPTDDDLTRQALADAMDQPLVEDPTSLQQLEDFFRQRGYAMADRNRVQATHPRGSEMIPNAAGTAPGIAATLDRAAIFVTPGVPREMKAMFDQAILPRLTQRLTASGAPRRVILTTKINTFGRGESDVAEQLGQLMQRDRNPTVGTTVSGGLCSVRVRAEGPDAAEAAAALEDTARLVEDRLGAIAFGRDEATLPEAVLALLRDRRATLATAESCTGGLIGTMLTDVPGSSASYLGGWVTYTNDLKSQQLGVADDTLQQHGAVSSSVVEQMARGARQRAGSTYALAVSGVAGPGGGTEQKPVGTVWLALAGPDQTLARLARLSGSRAAIRDRAAKCALQMLRLTLLNQPLDHLRWLRTEETPSQEK